ncbi:PDZ domain-containing protein [Myxococcota bacterium]|nr:PDZ domain-containing protein [Myxococcota bacterium]MBU1535207.1 PDZ domain-containing protein [Myxococcota bacterium]
MRTRIFSLFAIVFLGFVTPVQAQGQVGTSKNSFMNMKLTILYVIHRYVAPDRIDPSKMFFSGLMGAAKGTPEVMVRKKGNTITVSVGSKNLTVNGSIASPIYLVGAFQKVFDFLQKNLPSDVKIDDIENRMIAGMLETLDPHTNFLPPDLFKELTIHNSGAFGGLGIVVAVCGGKLSVLKVLPGTPASRASLEPGDAITRIDGQPTENLTLSEAVKRLRGEPASAVGVEISRKGWKKPKTFSIMRESIAYDSVVHKTISVGKEKVGYIKIKSFQIPTGRQVKKALKKMTGDGVKGVILDLRGNGGGLLGAAIEVTDLFLDSGTIVAQVAKNREKNLRHERRANMSSTLFRGPLVVLVDQGSASASEIVAGSLKYSGRALVLGRRSFGKGSVQDVITYSSDAALKITIAQYLTYGDVSIQGSGIEPDIQLQDVQLDPKNRGRKVIYYTSGFESTTEASLKAALKAARKKRLDKSLYTVYALAIPARQMSFKCRYCGLDPDDPIQRSLEDFVEDSAVNLGKTLITKFKGKKFSRKLMLGQTKSILAVFSAKEDKRIARKVEKLFGLSWKKGNSSKVHAKVTFGTSARDFPSNSWATMNLSFKNTGKTPVYRVRAVAKSTNPRIDFQEVLFGMVKPGQKLTRSVSVKIPKGVSAREDNVQFTFFSDRKPLGLVSRGHVTIVGSKLPKLTLTYRFSDTVRGDAMLEPGETGLFHVTIKNEGDGPTGEAKVLLKNLAGTQVEMVKSRFDISSLKPGASRNMTFKVRALRISGDLFWKFKLETKDCNFGNDMEIPWFVRRREIAPSTKISARGLVRLTSSTPVYDTPFKTSRIRQMYGLKTGLHKVAYRMGDFYAVYGVKKGEYLYVPVKGAPLLTSGTAVKPVLLPNFTAPSITLKNPRLQVKGRVTLTGTVSDVDGIRDFYVTVSNIKKRVFTEKVHYFSGNGVKKHNFNVSVALTPGVNILTVFARDIHKASYSKNVVVYSQK